MTTPDAKAATPYLREYTELCAELARTLPLADGLAAILGAPASRPPAEPGQADHAALVADLAATIDLRAGAAEILASDEGSDFVAVQLRLWLDECGHPSFAEMAELSRGTAHRYSAASIKHKLIHGGPMDWPFVETIVTAGHRHADRPGDPDLASWRRKYDQVRVDPHWVGAAPILADSFQSRRIGADLGHDLVPGRSFVLTGLGGVGKTQLAAGLAHRAWAEGSADLVVWVAAISRAAVVSAFAEAATKVGIAGAGDEEAAAQQFLARLIDERDRRWLIVLDDVLDPADLDGLWPPTGNGNTVVTTRGPQAAFAGDHRKIIKVGVFEPDESLRYLRDKLDDDPLDLVALADALGHLPLALAQAVAYLSNHGLSCAEYLSQFRQLRLRQLAPDKPTDEYAAVVASTWNLSIEAADKRQPERVARPLLELAALLSPDGIPAAVFATTAVQKLLNGRRRRATTADDARTGLDNLKQLSLVEMDDGRRVVRVHDLVQRAVREEWPTRRADKALAAADALLEIWPDRERDATLVEMLRNNTDALVQAGGDALWHGGLHPVVFRAGNSRAFRGLPIVALAYWESLLPTALRLLGPDHPDSLTIRHNLAWALGKSGDEKRALAQMRELLPARRRVLGADHPNTLATRYSIAEFQAFIDDYGGAVAVLPDLIGDYLRVLGPDEIDTLNTRLLLANVLGETQSSEVAVGELRSLLEDYRRVCEPEDPEPLRVELKLAGWLVSAGRVGEAQSRVERLAAEFHRLSGPDDVDTLSARYYLADLREQAGDRAEAAGLMRELHNDVYHLLDLGHRELEEIHEMIELWSEEDWDPPV